ncbi:MAG: hypothetical protein ACYDD1_22085 [Caulobacteraceae bacterium]
MTAPAYRRPRNLLSAQQVAALVAMRDGGATWREIGRLVCKQDGACKRIYDRAVHQRAAQAEGGAMDKAA